MWNNFSSNLPSVIHRIKKKTVQRLFSLSCISFKEFCVITGQIGGVCMIFPDSIIVESNSSDGDFFMMKMDRDNGHA